MPRDPHDSLAIEPGTHLRLTDGSIVRVDTNPEDGVWLFCTYLSSPDDSMIGETEVPVYGTDVVAFANGETNEPE